MISDERIVWMVVEFPIPSSLFIKDSETYLYFSYLQQPKTCHKCGSDLHMVNLCDVYRTMRPKDRSNAVDLDPDETPGSNRNRTASESSSSSSDSDDELEDSKSGLSTDSDTDNLALLLSPSQASQGNVQNENHNGNTIPRPECIYTSNQAAHTSNHTGETVVLNHNTLSESVVPPHNSTHSQIPIPMARTSHISSSQPASVSSAISNKRKTYH